MPQEPLSDLFASELVPHLHQLLGDLLTHPYPTVESPPTTPKRASVALILRVQPHYSHWPAHTGPFAAASEGSTRQKLDAFFAQDWVAHGEPEILFIKRAANKHDKWTGHVAFPGGRRDPEDVDDCAAAVRETWEEVGIDLKEESGLALQAGNLTQTVVTSSWGAKPLLVYCPYVFILTSPTIPPLRLQPREVASAHWVPVRALLNPDFRTYWTQNTASRISSAEFGMKSVADMLIGGSMLFAAIRLYPSESKFATETEEYMEETKSVDLSPHARSSNNITVPLSFARRRLVQVPDTGATLLLWGLTLGVVGDFLDMIPPFDTLRIWIYPTFTPIDLRFWLWLLSWNYRRRKDQERQEELRKIEQESGWKDGMLVEVDEGERYFGRVRSDKRGRRGTALVPILPSYFVLVKRSVMLALATRITTIGFLTAWAYRRWFKS